MGVDLYVYTKSESVVTTDELRRHLHTQGWGVRFLLDQGTPALEPAPDGELRDSLDVMGWRLSSEHAAPAADAIDRRDMEAVQAFYSQGVVGTCGYGVESPYQYEEEFDPEEDAEMDGSEGAVEAWCLEAMREAGTRYNLRVRIRSSNLSYQFLEVVWQGIGQLREGLLEDPQSGEFRPAKATP
jgi:hypothetical protein